MTNDAIRRTIYKIIKEYTVPINCVIILIVGIRVHLGVHIHAFFALHNHSKTGTVLNAIKKKLKINK